jgi:hypothetical protein
VKCVAKVILKSFEPVLDKTVQILSPIDRLNLNHVMYSDIKIIVVNIGVTMSDLKYELCHN